MQKYDIAVVVGISNSKLSNDDLCTKRFKYTKPVFATYMLLYIILL